MVKVLHAVGFLLIGIGGSGIGSEGILMAVFGIMVLFGIGFLYVGWRYECEKRRKRKMEEADRQRRLAQTWTCYLSSNLLAGRDNSNM